MALFITLAIINSIKYSYYETFDVNILFSQSISADIN